MKKPRNESKKEKPDKKDKKCLNKKIITKTPKKKIKKIKRTTRARDSVSILRSRKRSQRIKNLIRG